jgi:hypothetical protein
MSINDLSSETSTDRPGLKLHQLILNSLGLVVSPMALRHFIAKDFDRLSRLCHQIHDEEARKARSL